MRSFATVARLGGISAAAERLGIAKSGVSRHVALLETHFGVKLLERGARSVKLTPAGERLVHRVQSILAEVDLLDDIALEESGGISGQVGIAATPEFGGLIADRFFPLVQERHPELSLVMRAGYAFEDMQDPATDVAFRVGTFKDDRLVARSLGGFRAWLVASPDFLAGQPVEKPEDLAERPCLIFRRDQAASTWTLFDMDDEGAAPTPVDVSGTLGVNSFTILRERAMAGQGVAFLPQFVVTEALVSGALVRILPRYASRRFPVFLTYRPGARRVARLDAFIAMAEEHVPALVPD